jgi:hypothetical protein
MTNKIILNNHTKFAGEKKSYKISNASMIMTDSLKCHLDLTTSMNGKNEYDHLLI